MDFIDQPKRDITGMEGLAAIQYLLGVIAAHNTFAMTTSPQLDPQLRALIGSSLNLVAAGLDGNTNPARALGFKKTASYLASLD